MTIHTSVIAHEGIEVLSVHLLFSFPVDSIAYKVSQQSVNLVSAYKLALLVKNYANPLSIFWLFNFFGTLCRSVHSIPLTFHWYSRPGPNSHQAGCLMEVTRHFLLLGCCLCNQVSKGSHEEGNTFQKGEDHEFQLSSHCNIMSRNIYGKFL